MGVKKSTKKSSKKSSSLGSKIKGAAKSALGMKSSGGGRRRSRGPTYYANKVLVEKLKRKLYKLKYGGR